MSQVNASSGSWNWKEVRFGIGGREQANNEVDFWVVRTRNGSG
jgi:hypothetical protein